jgi:hypothetical protein
MKIIGVRSGYREEEDPWVKEMVELA